MSGEAGMRARSRLRRRLTLLTTLVIAGVLFLSAAIVLTLDARRQRQQFFEDAMLKTAAVATNARAALAFQDPEFAATALQAFGLEPSVIGAVVLDRNGQVLAVYPENGEAVLPDEADDGGHFSNGELHVQVPAELEGERLGSVFARFDTAPIFERLYTFAGTVLFSILVAGGLAWLLAWRMHAVVLHPLTQLAATMRRVSESADYTMQLESERDDEIGDLYESFNYMLAQVRERDRQVEEYSHSLERKVQERTARLRDLNESLQQEMQERLKALGEMRKLTGALEQTADSVMITDADGVIEYVNPAFEQISGYRREDVIGRKPSLLRSDAHDEDFFKGIWKELAAGRAVREVFVNRRPDGTLYHEEKTITPMREPGGGIVHFVATGKDISDRIRLEEELRFRAHHDAVTGLPNRLLLTDRIEQAVERARRRSSGLAVLFIDLDGFKAINDTVGHQAGDRVLVEVADRLRRAVRAEDTVARLGGDEFAVVLEDIVEDDVRMVADKIIAAIAEPIRLFSDEMFVTASVGASLYPKDGADAQTLIRAADNAMYRAKRTGKNRLQMYALEESTEDGQRVAFEQELHRAFNNREFEIVYQPQVAMGDGGFVGMEALLRWRRPDGSLLEPALFMRALEDTGLILSVDDWVLRTACAQAAAWREAGLGPFRLAVNVSVLQFARHDFVEQVREVLEATRLPPEWLHLEITESVLARDLTRVARILRKLAALGISIAVDDFGVGYSSLNYLKRLPIHRLKIDKTFVQDLLRDDSDAKITVAIISLAKSLNLAVIAEGVENEEQFEFLRRNGCDEAQGYLFGGPMSIAEFEQWFACRTGGAGPVRPG